MKYEFYCPNDGCENNKKVVPVEMKMTEYTDEVFCPICNTKMKRTIDSFHGSYRSCSGFYASSQS